MGDWGNYCDNDSNDEYDCKCDYYSKLENKNNCNTAQRMKLQMRVRVGHSLTDTHKKKMQCAEQTCKKKPQRQGQQRLISRNNSEHCDMDVRNISYNGMMMMMIDDDGKIEEDSTYYE